MGFSPTDRPEQLLTKWPVMERSMGTLWGAWLHSTHHWSVCLSVTSLLSCHTEMSTPLCCSLVISLSPAFETRVPSVQTLPFSCSRGQCHPLLPPAQPPPLIYLWIHRPMASHHHQPFPQADPSHYLHSPPHNAFCSLHLILAKVNIHRKKWAKVTSLFRLEPGSHFHDPFFHVWPQAIK